jgi:hypothetical protein
MLPLSTRGWNGEDPDEEDVFWSRLGLVIGSVKDDVATFKNYHHGSWNFRRALEYPIFLAMWKNKGKSSSEGWR